MANMKATAGQIMMELASVLSKSMSSSDAFDMAMRIVDAGAAPAEDRAVLGDKAADALDADLAEML